MFEPYSNKKLINLDDIKNKILNDFFDKKLHHSLIFIGSKGLGKATLCYHLANKILDDENSFKSKSQVSLFGDAVDDNILDENNPTFNLIKNRKHPDLLVIERGVDPKTSKVDREIKVASARKILDFMTLAPFVSKNKVIIIDSIDEMNKSSQNAILKALEEPVKDTYIFLVCHNINNVLETIRSRCRELSIPNYNFEEWKTAFEYINKEKFKSLSDTQLLDLFTISNGSISFALDIIEEDGLFLYNQIENIFSQKIPNVEDIQNIAEQLNNNEKLFNLFNVFLLLFLYNILKYFTIALGDENFKLKNTNFILKNNEKSILEKIKLTQSILKDIEIFNLNKKHAVIVLFTMIIR